MKKIKKRDIDIKTNQKLPLYFTALAFFTFAAIIIALSFLIFIGNKILGWDYMIDLHQSQFWVLVFMAIVLIGVIASILIGRPILKGIKEISNSTKKISEGDFSVRISENKTKFLGRLSHDFNQMAKELEGVKILRNDFINNFSHEFKTPISSIKNYAEELRNNNLTKEEKDKYLDIIIKEATRLSNLSNSILYLSKVEKQSILTDKKTRGIYGEVHLKHLMSNIFGEKNDTIYKLQYPLPNGTIVDCILFAPSPLGTIGIDSKFPLENYQRMVDRKLSKEERLIAERNFKIDVKRHIDAIATKYIIDGVTSRQAIMFLPAEAIFAEINAYHQDLIDYAYKKHIFITSPTTLISTLTVIQMIIKNMEKDKYTSIIHEELNKLGLEFARYKERWDKLSKSIQTVNKEALDVSITTDKISKKFTSINQVDIKSLKEKV